MSDFRVVNAIINGQVIPIAPFDSESDNYFTVIIGNNATGKSRLLLNILGNLRKAGNYRLKSSEDSIQTELKVKDKLIKISNLPGEIPEVLKQSMNLMSISNSLFDKFPHSSKNDDSYSYIGARMEGMTHKRAIINDLMDVFSSNLEDDTFTKKAKDLFKFLEISSIIKIALRAPFSSSNRRYQDVFKNNKTPEMLKKYLIEISQQGFYRQQSRKIYKYTQDDKYIEGLHIYLKDHLYKVFELKDNVDQFYTIDIENPSKNKLFIKEYKYFSLLRRLNLLTYNYIKLKKGDTEYDMQDSSTGEIGLLATFLRAVPEMKSNSIIFIDEPEISLHPSWQMKYIDLLQKFLKGYKNCHIIIATHSHLLLSDLKREWSSVLVLKDKKNNQINAELIEYSPYGWSPEAILYDIFGVANVRNHYFEMDVKKLLYLISNSPNKTDEIEKRYEKLKRFDLDENDPVKILLAEAKKLIS
jgi:predicted ATPase